jgi:thiol-disulfide isomerase/thioredoxin
VPIQGFRVISIIITLWVSLQASPILAQYRSKLGKIDLNASPSNSNTTEYPHSWQKFPSLVAESLPNREPYKISPQPGEALVIVFLASWCLPCQQLIEEMKRIENAFDHRFTQFYYIFAHDTLPDAQGFVKTYQVGENVVLGTPQILEDFHQPPLPSLYVADRYGWMVMRLLDTQRSDLETLIRFLKLHTAN